MSPGTGLLVGPRHGAEQEAAPDDALGRRARQRVLGDLLEQAVAQQQPVRRERVVGEHLPLHDLAQLVGHRLGDGPLDHRVALLVELADVPLEPEPADAVLEVGVLDRARREVVVEPADDLDRVGIAGEAAAHPDRVRRRAVGQLALGPSDRLGPSRVDGLGDRQDRLVVAVHAQVGVGDLTTARRDPTVVDDEVPHGPIVRQPEAGRRVGERLAHRVAPGGQRRFRRRGVLEEAPRCVDPPVGQELDPFGDVDWQHAARLASPPVW